VSGAGKGYAAVVDRRNDSRSYLRVSRFEVGGGLGLALTPVPRIDRAW
jgi:hypothetical protein